MNSKLILGVVVAVFACYVDGHPMQSCSSGSCIPLSDCPYFETLGDKENKTPEEEELLKKSQCESEEGTPKVCCDPCYNPDGNPGTCVDIDQCAHLADMLKEPLSRSDNKVYFENTKCKGPDHQSVCCGPPREIRKDLNTKCAGFLTAFPQDPNADLVCCGREAKSSNRIFGGNVTAIDQFTWLALLEYYSKDGKLAGTPCGGSLISGKYVLTAAHCVTGDILSNGTPKKVRLAEYDISNLGIDRAKESGGGYDENTGTVTIRIETIISHPGYDSTDKQKGNDIALIRLQQSAPFTDFLRPICLPTVDRTLNPPEKFTMFVAGWGAVSISDLYSNIKQFVDLPFVPADQCQEAFKGITLGQGQLCAGGEPGKDSCRGDSGGPLMYEDPNTNTFELVGVVSFGSSMCGFWDQPAVYTKVFAFRDWILSEIKP